MVCEAAAFETERLSVCEWRAGADRAPSNRDLPGVVAAMMTEPVTRSLPPQWQGAYDEQRATEWIAARNLEGPTLLVADRSSGEALGLVILFEIESCDTSSVDVRLGYLLAESAWGRGLASELIAGLVEWCRAAGRVRSLTGGVATDNPASMRVLEKNGFRPLDDASPHEEILYELMLHG